MFVVLLKLERRPKSKRLVPSESVRRTLSSGETIDQADFPFDISLIFQFKEKMFLNFKKVLLPEASPFLAKTVCEFVSLTME